MFFLFKLNKYVEVNLRHNSIMSILKESINNEETKQNAQWALEVNFF